MKTILKSICIFSALFFLTLLISNCEKEQSINKKYYLLSDKKNISKLSESMPSILRPGENKSNIADAVNTNENYGTWSDKNDNPVIGIKIDKPEIQFALEDNGKKYGWGEFGKVHIYAKGVNSSAYKLKGQFNCK
jgi:hypothetical protein